MAKLQHRKRTSAYVWILLMMGFLYALGSWRLTGQLTARPVAECGFEEDFSFLCHDPAVSFLQVQAPITKKPKILCVILTQSKNEARMQAILDTWGAKCDRIVAASDKEDPKLNTYKVESLTGYWGFWDKLMQTLKRVVEDPEIRAQNFDWILKADDDTYVIMENLHAFLASLSDYDPSQPTVFGRTIAWPRLTRFEKTEGWFSHPTNAEFGKRLFSKVPSEDTLRFSHGGPGYFMNWKYVETLVKAYFSDGPHEAMHGEVAEDMANAVTMLYHGIRPSSTYDAETGRERMHPESPQTMYANPIWLGRMHHGIKPSLGDGVDCCSPTSISYHYVADFQMRLLHYQLYHCPNTS